MAQFVPSVPRADATVTRLPLRFNDSEAVRWQERFRQHLAEGRILHVIDVDAADLLSATMLGFLIHVSRMARDRGGAVGLVATREKALHTLEVTGLTQVFRIARTVAEATAMIAAPRGISNA